MNSHALFKFSIGLEGLDLHVGIVLVILLIVALIGVKLFSWWKYHDIIEANIHLGGIGSVTIKPNHTVSQIAHEVWVELQTRKAALPFDSSHDLIIEIYDSWYQLFKEIRQLLRKIPAEKIKYNDDAKKLTNILTQSLNCGLRPHLTEYQAKFRKWYAEKLEETNSLSPQEIQRTYPEYKQLVAALEKTNSELIEYAKFINELAHGKVKDKS